VPAMASLLTIFVFILWTATRPSTSPHTMRGSKNEGFRPLTALPRPPLPPADGHPVWVNDDDPWASASLRARPDVRAALVTALHAAMQEAENNVSADPLELLATQLQKQRSVASSSHSLPRPRKASPAALPESASSIDDMLASDLSSAGQIPECRGLGLRTRRRCRRADLATPRYRKSEQHYTNFTPSSLPYPPASARVHGLPPKLPTAAMWPPLRRTTSGSAFRSLGRVAPYRGGDLEQPGELAKASAARSYRGELILTYGNEAGTAWIANLIFSLRSVGIEHSLVIVMSDGHCRALNRPPWLISCAWSSWDFGQRGTGTHKRYEGQQCNSPYEMRRLWYSRHHYMSRVIEELGLNVAVIDGDMSVRSDFYRALKQPPLDGHNLIYTLDHSPKCGDLNVGFAYCQGCAPRGRAQWVIDEGLRREGYFCGGASSEFGDGGRFWNISDAMGATRGPHRWQQWASARDQKVYSDVVGGSCCGAPQHRLMFPSSYKVVDQYAFMRQYGQHAKCMTMVPEKANGLQTWWHQLLQGPDDSNKPMVMETVAIATGQLASGWHGTGEGEMAGWAGHWHYRPPAIAHFVGGAPAGGKVDLMQGLSWWLYEADVVAHAVMEETGKKAGMALPKSFFSARSQRGLLAFAGAAATLRLPTRAAFVTRFVAMRFWLLQLAVVLKRTAVDPQPHCDSAWIPSDTSTAHQGGYRGKWYTPGWPWPFKDGVGVVMGNCSYPQGATSPQAIAECCSAIFGQLQGVKCLETAHHMVLEQMLAARVDAPGGVSIELPLASAYNLSTNAIDLNVVRLDGSVLAQPVLWVRLPEATANGGALPQLVGLTPTERETLDELLHDECREMLSSISGVGDGGEALGAPL